MKNIIQTLLERQKKQTGELVSMCQLPDNYWSGLPFYAGLYIRTPYEMITDMEGLYEFIQYFMVEHSMSDNQFKRTAIESVIFPLYEAITGNHYNQELKAYGLNNPKI